MDDKDVSGKLNRATMEALADDLFERTRIAMLTLLQNTSTYLYVLVLNHKTKPAVMVIITVIVSSEPYLNYEKLNPNLSHTR